MMSRGPGKAQRRIIEVLEQDPNHCKWLVDLLPAGYSRSEYNSLYRAAMKLNDAGKISVRWFQYGKETVAMALPGVDPTPILRGSKSSEEERTRALVLMGMLG